MPWVLLLQLEQLRCKAREARVVASVRLKRETGLEAAWEHVAAGP